MKNDAEAEGRTEKCFSSSEAVLTLQERRVACRPSCKMRHEE